MSESMMVKGSDRIAENSTLPVLSPISEFNQPVTYARAAPDIANMPPTVTFTLPQNTVLILAAGCLILLGFVIGAMMFRGHKRHKE